MAEPQNTTAASPSPVDLSGGLVPKIDLSGGLIPNDPDVTTIGGQPVNLKTGVGATQAAVNQAGAVAPEALDKTQETFTYPAAGPGGPLVSTKVSPQKARQLEAEGRDARMDAGKQTLIAGGAMIAPELLPEMAGSGFLAYLGRLLARAGASGVGAGVGTSAGQAATGENPLKPENLKEAGQVAGTTALVSVPFEALSGLSKTKIGRSAINQSLGAQTRDITYGNPAKALVDEGIGSVTSGDFEQYKAALKAGKTPADAAHAAGGRFAAVSQRINEYAPQLEKMLAQSTKTIPVADAIDAPLHQAALDIINNRAMTDAEKDAAINQLGALQKSLREGLGSNVSPLELNRIKQSIGKRVNWGGTVSITDEVKPAYRSLYGNMNRLISDAVPEARELNERLSNLLAAHGDLETLMKAEEVGRGGGIAGGKVGSTVMGVAEREAGRVLPGASDAANAAAMPARAGTAVGTEHWVHVQTSDGKKYEVHPEDLAELQRRDPKAKVIQ